MKLGTFWSRTITVLMCHTRERYTHFMAFNQETFLITNFVIAQVCQLQRTKHYTIMEC